MSLPHVPIFLSKVKLSLPNNNSRVSLAEHVYMNAMQTREASQLVGQRERDGAVVILLGLIT
ncbi:hypothetical protein ACTXT7_000841 [Hymenolepis weldensis]